MYFDVKRESWITKEKLSVKVILGPDQYFRKWSLQDDCKAGFKIRDE